MSISQSRVTILCKLCPCKPSVPGKEGGVVVDYIGGFATSLKEATHKYTQSGGTGSPTYDISEAVNIFMDHLKAVRGFIPSEIDVQNWRAKPKIERED